MSAGPGRGEAGGSPSAKVTRLARLRLGSVALLHEPLLRRRAWIVLAAVLACLYSFTVLGYVLTTPEIGVRCAFTPVVNHFYPEFLVVPVGTRPEERKQQVQEGDRIVQLGDQAVETWSHLLRKIILLRDEQPAVIDGLTIEHLRSGRVPGDPTFVLLDGQRVIRLSCERVEDGETVHRDFWCRLGRSPVEALLPSISWFFLKLGLFVVGAVILWKRPEDGTAAQFFLLCIVTVGAYMGGYHWSRIVTQPVLLVVFMSCAVLLPAVTLHFYLVFPRPKPFFESRRWTVLLAVYGPPLLFLLTFMQGYFHIRWLDQGGTGWLGGIEGALRDPTGDPASGIRLMLLQLLYAIYVYFGLAAVWYLCSIASLFYSYRTAASAVERDQVKWILAGAAASLVPVGYTLYLAFCRQGRFGAGAAAWPMFAASACMTVGMAFSITRYRLFQLEQVISSGAVYFLISFLAGMVYYGVVFAILLLVGSQSAAGPSLGQVLGISGAVMVLMVALDLLRGRVLRVVERHFRREKHQLDRTLQRMSQTIERLVDPTTLARQLLHTTTELLSAPSGAIYLRQGEPALYRLTDAIGLAPPLTELSSGCPLVEALLTQPAVAADTPGSAPALRQLSFLHGVVGQALLHEGQLLGLLVLGPREGEPYTGEELHILAAFTRMTVLALVSAEGHRTIEGLNQELKEKVEKIAEQQRRILALQSQLSRREERKAPAEEPVPPPLPPVAPAEERHGGRPLLGSSPQVQQLLHLVKRVAASSSAVLLRGESGTGKELLARELHENSPRAQQPFIKVHCAALSPGLLESELFGHVKGAFTSAIRDKVGRFEAADGGTLFLDEIGDISLEVQTKLLRVLEEMSFERVGSSEPVHVDVRIIAATHRDLEGMIAEGRFREDLYFRLNVLPIHVPPLRERAEDVPELALHFLRLYALTLGKPVKTIDDEAMVALKGYPWPGNVRQLENVIERAVVIAEGGVIGLAELPEEVKAPASVEEVAGNGVEEALCLSLPELASAIKGEQAERDRREREQLVRVLAAVGGNKAEAARALGVPRSTLVSRLKKYGLS